ncbi:cupin domain-containing protein [Rhizobium leguminosarum]|uniref:Cupin domain-containing protein n=1 Tax=Rhizobium leguminosarum TaxID=384 RepID=A0A6P0BEH7_RHILE|nr:cupin domain-containing protein [Rhizobium leguminosarum]NEI37546.1 cupin domain-containing protein [Rhizobium leguminosarum]NEI44187.1 cupin domain-containing protein [Rhizobium leguminosarum]
MQSPVNLLKATEAITDYWLPKVVGRVNDQDVKVAKLRGEIAWHKHDDEDELFLVLRGRLMIEFVDGVQMPLNEGALCVVPRGCLVTAIQSRYAVSRPLQPRGALSSHCSLCQGAIRCRHACRWQAREGSSADGQARVLRSLQ